MKGIKENKEVSIMKIPIKTPKEVAFEMCMDDRILINAICEYRKQLEKADVEVFYRKENVIACEDGYYFAMYEKDKVEVEGGTFNPNE